jgi:hypothetical protein
MNRKERRRTSKNLGIMEYQKKLSRKEKFDLMRENIISGKEQHKQYVDEVRRQQSMTKEEKESERINVLAEQIAKSKNISLIDAVEEAQSIINKKTKK